MVNNLGQWIEEKDYSTYPKEKWCDYDYMAAWIREKGYKPKTSMDNLMCMIFLHFDGELEDGSDEYYTDETEPYMNRLTAYVSDCGISEFDYEP